MFKASYHYVILVHIMSFKAAGSVADCIWLARGKYMEVISQRGC